MVAEAFDQGTGAAKSIIGRLSRLDTYAHTLPSDVASEIDALAYLRRALDPDRYIPPAGGWAAEYKSIAYLVSHILESETIGKAVEFGSGVSTIWMGLALKSRGEGHLTCIEHDEEYAGKTRRRLVSNGLTEHVTIEFAPLGPVKTSQGEANWYQLGNMLSQIRDISLLFVDGPPAVNDPLVRKPALEVLGRSLQDGALIVLDDFDRHGEQDIVNWWIGHSREFTGGVVKQIESIGRAVALQFHAEAS